MVTIWYVVVGIYLIILHMNKFANDVMDDLSLG